MNLLAGACPEEDGYLSQAYNMKFVRGIYRLPAGGRM